MRTRFAAGSGRLLSICLVFTLIACVVLVGVDGAPPLPGSVLAVDQGETELKPGSLDGRRGAAKEKLLKRGGGNADSEAAVAAGLKWLVRHQAPNGQWSLEAFARHGRCTCTGMGLSNDTAATAFGLLPLLGAGHTHKGAAPESPYAKNVERGVRSLLSMQKANGDLGGGMYGHGLATIAVCEAYAMTSDPALKNPAQRAVNYIVKAQHQAGGWRYAPGQAGDTSVTSWQVVALKTGAMAGLDVPDKTWKSASAFLDSVQDPNGGYGYTGPQATPTLTAAGLICRGYLGWEPGHKDFDKGVKYLRSAREAAGNVYHQYYAAQALHHIGGEDWEAWSTKMRDRVVGAQDQGKDSRHLHHEGSWSPQADAMGASGGRIMITSMNVLALESYYRHVPLFPGKGSDKDER